jgi:hypothetical protein
LVVADSNFLCGIDGDLLVEVHAEKRSGFFLWKEHPHADHELHVIITEMSREKSSNFQFLFRNITIGGGLIRLPGRNYARYHLMVYVLFCLIMRTGYQGKQFEFMLKVEIDFISVHNEFTVDH